MTVKQVGRNASTYMGLSGDTKPAADVGATFYETDTGDTYIYDGSWHELPASGGGVDDPLELGAAVFDELTVDGQSVVGVLADPGNVYEPQTLVAVGHRIKETIDGEVRVFEVVTGGTTGEDAAIVSVIPNFNPRSTFPDGAEVVWRYLGIVGDLPWSVVPEINFGGRTNRTGIKIHRPTLSGPLLFDHEAEPADSEAFVSFVGDGQEVFTFQVDGDADWTLYSGAAFAFNDGDDGGATRLRISQDIFLVSAGAITVLSATGLDGSTPSLYSDTPFDFVEKPEPDAPFFDAARVFAKDNGAGKTQLCVRFATGATQVIATEP